MGRPKKPNPEHEAKVGEAVIAHTLAQVDKLVAILRTHGYRVEISVEKPMSGDEVEKLHN